MANPITEHRNSYDTNVKVDTTVVQLVQKLLLKSLEQGASDIHFEPLEHEYRVRIRIDGLLQTLATLEVNLVPRVTARLKILAKLDIAEKRLPQDGHFSIPTVSQKSTDFRMSTCPTTQGEKIVLRILQSQAEHVDLANLGLLANQEIALRHAIEKPQGMVLVTGPTGSGKTMTLYAALKTLNRSDCNICSVEDPVEMELAGINQVDINTKVGMTFANTLRTFLRQDPDIIMLGEIRDEDTADIAIKAAQTGHLVLSTLHTNTAIDTLTRLHHLGIADYNIASSVRLIIAQRLVRKLCQHCREPVTTPSEKLLSLGFTDIEIADIVFYAAKSCEQCHSGYKGRIGIFEVLVLSENLQEKIIAKASRSELLIQAAHENFIDLRHASLQKLREGLTTLDELQRVLA